VRFRWERFRVAHEREFRSHFFGGVRIDSESAGDVRGGPFRVQGGVFEKEENRLGRRFTVRFGRARRSYRSYVGRFSSGVWHRIKLWLCVLPPNTSSCVWTGACVPQRTCLGVSGAG